MTTPNPDPTKGAYLACYAFDMHWSAFPTDLKELCRPTVTQTPSTSPTAPLVSVNNAEQEMGIVVEALVSEAKVALAEEAAQLKYMGASANTIPEFSEVDEDTISEISEVDEDIVVIKRGSKNPSQ